MKTISSQIEVEASPKRIWDVITDPNKYAEWHPTIWSIDGQFRYGQHLTLHLQTDNRHNDVKREIVLNKVEAPHQLSWYEGWRIPILLRGEYHLRIDPIDRNHSRFIQEMSYSGLLLPLLANRIEQRAQRDLQIMEQALKDHLQPKTQRVAA